MIVDDSLSEDNFIQEDHLDPPLLHLNESLSYQLLSLLPLLQSERATLFESPDRLLADLVLLVDAMESSDRESLVGESPMEQLASIFDCETGPGD